MASLIGHRRIRLLCTFNVAFRKLIIWFILRDTVPPGCHSQTPDKELNAIGIEMMELNHNLVFLHSGFSYNNRKHIGKNENNLCILLLEFIQRD